MDSELIKKYEKNLDWTFISQNPNIKWTEDLINEFKDNWNWCELSENEYLPWSEDFINKYRNKFKVENNKWQYNNAQFFYFGFLKNKGIPQTQKMIETFIDDPDFYSVAVNENMPWNKDLIKKFWSELKCFESSSRWPYLSLNTKINWSPEILEEYYNNWDWNNLSNNPSLPWSEDFIYKYNNKWNWNNLSNNRGINWTIELIEKFSDKWDYCSLGMNPKLPWTIELIEKFKDKWIWTRILDDDIGLSSNKGINWTIELIEKFKDKWDYESIAENYSFYNNLILPILNDKIINELMNIN